MTDSEQRAERLRTIELAIERLEAAELTESGWAEVAATLDAVLRAHEADDRSAVDASVVQLSNRAFGVQVRARLRTDRRHAAAVAPTKQSPVLPTVGLVCGGVLLLLGWSLGGGVLVVATAVLAVFVLGVAVAGTQRVMQRTARRGTVTTEPLAGPPPAELRALMRDVVVAVREPPEAAPD